MCLFLETLESVLEKTLMLRKIEGRRRNEQQRMNWLDGVPDSLVMTLSKLWGTVRDRETWCAAVHGVPKNRTDLVTERQQQRLYEFSLVAVTNFHKFK